MSKVCKDCKEDLDLDKFHKSNKSKDGYKNACKECLKYYNTTLKRKHKAMRSKDDVTKFIADLCKSGELFKCKKCSQEFLADQFYTKRDYNKIYLAMVRCKNCERYYQIFRKFKITEEEYLERLDQQKSCCGVCKRHISEYSKQGYRDHFSVDHCHDTGEIRGLLCDQCNRGLGYFKESTTIVENALEYLKEYDIV